jgi:hypothetical protein
MTFPVIPAKANQRRSLAGIQEKQAVLDPGACPGHDPGFAGVTALMTFYETITFKTSIIFHSGFQKPQSS